jgi:translation initiation factor 4G
VQKLEEIRSMDIPPEDKEERENILKKSYTGHMRFIGEIYMKGLVKANIMHSCVEELLQNTGEEVLVCLIKLLTTIGAELEKYDQRRQKKNVATYFKQIEKMAVEHPSSRMRYMLKVCLSAFI